VVRVIVLALLLAAGCSIQSNLRRDSAELRVIAEPAVARVYVNDRFVGTGRRLAQRPHRLNPGVHYVTIESPGFFPHDLRMELPEGETTVRISLRPVPP
jgi:hypothetical protein